MRQLIVVALLTVVGFIVYGANVTPNPSDHDGTAVSAVPRSDSPAPASNVKPTVNFDLPLFTTANALVCPLSVAFDRREGYGLDAAMQANLTLLGHDEAVEKIGCQNWRADEPIFLSDEGKRQATVWDNAGNCGMADFVNGFVFTCDLKNLPIPNSLTAEGRTDEPQ